MFTKEEPLSLSNLGDGAALEMFEEELQKVLDNIVDPNTKAKSPREITLKIRITPDDERQLGMVELICTSKMTPARSFNTNCLLGRVGRRGEAREIKTAQTSFIDKDKVVQIDRKEAGGD